MAEGEAEGDVEEDGGPGPDEEVRFGRGVSGSRAGRRVEGLEEAGEGAVGGADGGFAGVGGGEGGGVVEEGGEGE